MTTKRDGRALWKALQEQKALDELDDIMEMSDEDLDKYIDENGGDAAQIRKAGRELSEKLFADRERLGWQKDAAAQHERVRNLASARATRERLSRAEMRNRLEVARQDPRFSGQVAAFFHAKKDGALTDDELRAMLEQMDLLSVLHDEKKE